MGTSSVDPYHRAWDCWRNFLSSGSSRTISWDPSLLLRNFCTNWVHDFGWMPQIWASVPKGPTVPSALSPAPPNPISIPISTIRFKRHDTRIIHLKKARLHHLPPHRHQGQQWLQGSAPIILLLPTATHRQQTLLLHGHFLAIFWSFSYPLHLLSSWWVPAHHFAASMLNEADVNTFLGPSFFTDSVPGTVRYSFSCLLCRRPSVQATVLQKPPWHGMSAGRHRTTSPTGTKCSSTQIRFRGQLLETYGAYLKNARSPQRKNLFKVFC